MIWGIKELEPPTSSLPELGAASKSPRLSQLLLSDESQRAGQDEKRNNLEVTSVLQRK